jgi:hypothetical protein
VQKAKTEEAVPASAMPGAFLEDIESIAPNWYAWLSKARALPRAQLLGGRKAAGCVSLKMYVLQTNNLVGLFRKITRGPLPAI